MGRSLAILIPLIDIVRQTLYIGRSKHAFHAKIRCSIDVYNILKKLRAKLGNVC
jgi:hypothetical protein